MRLARARSAPAPGVLVDETGLHFDAPFSGSLDVVMEGRRVWSFGTTEQQREVTTVEWPVRLRRRLEGTADVRIVAGDRELYAGEVRFSDADGRPRFVDNHGIPLFVDKWGLIQRPFEGRRESGVVEQMVDHARRVLEVMREQCGIEGWISFGTLLGAQRDGRVIGHDSDIDLNYLSERQTPAEMAVELWDIGRALRSAGLDVQLKSASFLTVRFRAADGGMGSIDVYTCFYVEDRLHETATVRAPVPRSAVLPLREMSFEGHQLPGPADPDRLLTVSYGPSWRVPDPSFRHLPGPEVVQRFDGWFGSLMKWRRDWTTHNTRLAQEAREAGVTRASRFARWVVPQLTDVVRVIEVGCGAGLDLAAYAGSGRRVVGVDFALPRGGVVVPPPPEAQAAADAGTTTARRRPARMPGVSARELNLDDLRDVLTLGALLSRGTARQAVVARRLVEALTEESTDAFFTFCSMVLHRGGRLYLEGVARTPPDAEGWQSRHESGRIRSLDPARVARQAEASGGRILSRAGFDEAALAVRAGQPATWRMTVEWGPTARSRP